MSQPNPQQTTESTSVRKEPGLHFFLELYKEMNEERNVDKLKEIGGVQELAKALGVDLDLGIQTTPEGQERFTLEDRIDVFGINTMKHVTRTTPFPWTNALLKRQILTPLIVAAMINTILGLSFEQERDNMGWITSIGIWVVVLVIVLAGILTDLQLFSTQEEMNREKAVFDVTVVRDGKECLIKNSELLVGDILVLTKDVTVAADGLLFFANDLFINEEIITGESKSIAKKLIEAPFCQSGTQVTSGSGRILVTSVGEESELGQTLKMVSKPSDHAEKSIHIVGRIFLGFAIAAMCLGIANFIVLLIRWMVHEKGFPIDEISTKGPVQFLILAIVIMVVEIQEGYFLVRFFVQIYMTWKSMKDKTHVLTPDVFGWMAQINSICFDKTGTLTENKMKVVEGWFYGTYFDGIPMLEELDPRTLELITENAILNSEAFLIIEAGKATQYVGNQTECALLCMAKEFGVDYSEVRLQKRPQTIKHYDFNSDKKMSSVIVRHEDLLRLYNKGAAEMVLEKCTEYIDMSGTRCPITKLKRTELEATIEEIAVRGLRTLALSYTEFDLKEFNFGENGEPLDESADDKRGFAEAPEEDLVLLAIVGIKDPVRSGVWRAVKQFKQANIVVRMITGDNLGTAKRVAIECGIFTSDGLAMEGPDFRQRAEHDVEGLKRDLPKLQVMARSSPSDKQKLVKLLESLGDKVAVSGDGTNDARALKESTVGIAMGVDSTEVAREASDVVIMSDDISSILTLYLRSRHFKLSLFGYFQFRMTVTLVVWVIVLVSVCVGGETPLNAPQFLWANFIIDTLVVLTFATESLSSRVPDTVRYKTKDLLDDDSYLVHIVFQSLYQIIAIICTFYSWSSLFGRYIETEHEDAKMRKNSLMFNLFIFIQLFNALNCREVFKDHSVFKGLFNSPLSCAIKLITIGLQVMIMLTPVRTLFKVSELNAWEWLYSMAVSIAVMPLSTLIRFVTRDKERS